MPEVLWWVRVKPGLECKSSGSCQGPVCQPHPASSSSLLCWTRGHLLLGLQQGKCLGIWKVPLEEPDFYVLCHPSLTSGHWLRGSVQVGTVSPAGQDSRLPVVLFPPLPRCPGALWPPGLPALLWIPLPLLLLMTSPRALPPPENHPGCWTLLQLALAPFTHAGCHGLLWALLGPLGTS